MFARYAPLVAGAGAKVVLEAQPELKDLLAGLEGVAADRCARRAAAAVRSALSAGEPAACLQDRSGRRSGGHPLSARAGGEYREMAAAAGSSAVAADRAGLVRPRSPTSTIATVRCRWRSSSRFCRSPALSFVSVQRELRPGEAEMLAREPRITHLGGELDRLCRHRGGAGAVRSRGLRRHVGRPCRRRARPAGVRAAAVPAGLALDARSRRKPVVSGDAAVSAAGDRRLGQRHRAGAQRSSLRGSASLAARRDAVPHRFEPLAEGRRLLGEQPGGDRRAAVDVLGLALARRPIAGASATAPAAGAARRSGRAPRDPGRRRAGCAASAPGAPRSRPSRGHSGSTISI